MKGVVYVTDAISCSVGTRRPWTAGEKLSASQRYVRGWKPFIPNSSVCVSHPAACIPYVTPRIPEWGIAQSRIHSPSAPLPRWNGFGKADHEIRNASGKLLSQTGKQSNRAHGAKKTTRRNSINGHRYDDVDAVCSCHCMFTVVRGLNNVMWFFT